MAHPMPETVASFSEVQSFRENRIALLAVVAAVAACGGALARRFRHAACRTPEGYAYRGRLLQPAHGARPADS